MKIILYQNLSDPRYLFKKLRKISERSCDLKVPCTDAEPRFEITGGASFIKQNVNYCYVPDIGKYYYINSKIMEEGNRTTLVCKVDPLQSYNSYIAGIQALILRQEHLHNDYIPDANIKATKEIFTRYERIGSFEGSADKKCYCLTTSGGGNIA